MGSTLVYTHSDSGLRILRFPSGANLVKFARYVPMAVVSASKRAMVVSEK